MYHREGHRFDVQQAVNNQGQSACFAVPRAGHADNTVCAVNPVCGGHWPISPQGVVVASVHNSGKSGGAMLPTLSPSTHFVAVLLYAILNADVPPVCICHLYTVITAGCDCHGASLGSGCGGWCLLLREHGAGRTSRRCGGPSRSADRSSADPNHVPSPD
jgi:hypothetical protein